MQHCIELVSHWGEPLRTRNALGAAAATATRAATGRRVEKRAYMTIAPSVHSPFAPLRMPVRRGRAFLGTEVIKEKNIGEKIKRVMKLAGVIV